MARLTAFNNISLDGFFTDGKNDMSWAHARPDDVEFNSFVAENSQGGGTLVLGRKTYEMMAGFWPTDMAKQMMPDVAEGMNRMNKLVLSKSLKHPTWENSRVLKGDVVGAMKSLKETASDDMAILGSGTVVSLFAAAGLIDELQFVVNPVVLGAGRTLFEDVKGRLPFTHVGTRSFANGKVLLRYAPDR